MLYNLPMAPTPPATGVPPEIAEYLRNAGWTQWYMNNSYYYSCENFQGYLTWEQAVAYTLVIPVIQITK
jgi:hypothetical protein